jgi:hypothetical protein
VLACEGAGSNAWSTVECTIQDRTRRDHLVAVETIGTESTLDAVLDGVNKITARRVCDRRERCLQEADVGPELND